MNQVSLISLDELDAVLVDASGSDGYGSWHQMLQSVRLKPGGKCPKDPFSPAYAKYQMSLYQAVSGRSNYSFDAEEAAGTDQYDGITASHPYTTQDLPTIGSYLMGVGHVLKVLGNSRIASMLEYGPGWGHTTVAVARSGVRTYAFDLEKQFVRMINEQAKVFAVSVDARVGLFGDAPAEKVDAILFYECFHHCFNHDEILGKIKEYLNPGGRILLAGEPVESCADMPYPWGIRLDGHSLWAIRTHGWMELGFHEGYLIELFKRHGFNCQKHICPQAGEVGTIYDFTKRD